MSLDVPSFHALHAATTRLSKFMAGMQTRVMPAFFACVCDALFEFLMHALASSRAEEMLIQLVSCS